MTCVVTCRELGVFQRTTAGTRICLELRSYGGRVLLTFDPIEASAPLLTSGVEYFIFYKPYIANSRTFIRYRYRCRGSGGGDDGFCFRFV